jgi:hypothetical protein
MRLHRMSGAFERSSNRNGRLLVSESLGRFRRGVYQVALSGGPTMSTLYLRARAASHPLLFCRGLRGGAFGGGGGLFFGLGVFEGHPGEGEFFWVVPSPVLKCAKSSKETL